jgi:hypothetical protein
VTPGRLDLVAAAELVGLLPRLTEGLIGGHAVYNWQVFSTFAGAIACDCGWQSAAGLSLSGAIEEYALHFYAVRA